MTRKSYFTFLSLAAAAFLFLASSLTAFAQTARVGGKIQLKKADGTTIPLADAVIDVYRTDTNAKLPSNKTNKKGEFSFAGFLLGQTLMFAVSAPGVQPQIFPNIRPGQENITITVYEGDGKRLTEEEARQLFAAAKSNSGGGGTAASPQDEAAAKKAAEERQKLIAEMNAKNEKVKNINQVVDKAISDGKAAFDAKNYDAAIASYREGYQADPEFAGTAPVFLNNMAIAYRLRAFDTYKKSTTDMANKASLMESAKKDFQESANAFQKSINMLKTATSTDAKVQKDYETNRRVAIGGLVETRRLMVATRADTTQNKEAVAALEEYLAIETDAAAKTKMLILLADSLRLAGDSANAVPLYRKVLEITPDNVDVLGGLGLSLFDVGVSGSNKEQMQEGLNMMERFSQVAPETHPLKNDIKGAVEYLKTQEKLTPQKVSKPARKKT